MKKSSRAIGNQLIMPRGRYVEADEWEFGISGSSSVGGEPETIKINCNKKDIEIPQGIIRYITMDGNNALIHTQMDRIYKTRITLSELEESLGDNFIRVKRGCIVSVLAIHEIGDRISLSNGESLDYAQRSKKEILNKFHAKQEEMIQGFSEESMLKTDMDYHEHYKLFDDLSFAFADIEMVFDGEFNAVDWIFRYGNPALARLEKTPLENIIGNSFSSLFPNMDSKWLRTYERATLFGETLKIVDYSPEIDTYLDIICFPTFKGHCGCILFDISKITSFRNPTDAERALSFFIARLMSGN